jgi:hypothetical protein
MPHRKGAVPLHTAATVGSGLSLVCRTEGGREQARRAGVVAVAYGRPVLVCRVGRA